MNSLSLSPSLSLSRIFSAGMFIDRTIWIFTCTYKWLGGWSVLEHLSGYKCAVRRTGGKQLNLIFTIQFQINISTMCVFVCVQYRSLRAAIIDDYFNLSCIVSASVCVCVCVWCHCNQFVLLLFGFPYDGIINIPRHWNYIFQNVIFLQGATCLILIESCIICDWTT